jgi:hypothetical protein
MIRSIGLAVAVLVLAAASSLARADKSTVCTITVNSPDEKQVMRRFLPEDQYDFVELIETGKPDWLAQSCRRNVRCDVLVISGHFDGGTEFYSDRFDMRESLPVEDLERATCSNACPNLLSRLKEVYLFGCNTLNGDAGDSVAREIARTLARSGVATPDADSLARESQQRYAESNRDAMRRIFANVPVIYGFSSLAPLGASAGPLLAKVLQSTNAGEIATGRPSPALLKAFAPSSMVVTSGLSEGDPRSPTRAEACRYADPEATTAQKVASMHQTLDAGLPTLRMQFERIEKLAASIGAAQRAQPEVGTALADIAADNAARERYLRFARNTDRPEIRARMIRLSRSLGWLGEGGEANELAALIADQLQRPDLGYAEVELACALNADRRLDGQRAQIAAPPSLATRPAQSAVLACLGDPAARTRALAALASANDDDVHVAQVYLHHQPLAEAAEARAVTASVARMEPGAAQIRALDTLAFQRIGDHDSLERLAALFATSKSLAVQRAIAGILIRADHGAIAQPALLRTLRDTRVKSKEGADVIDVLIRRLQATASTTSTATPPA